LGLLISGSGGKTNWGALAADTKAQAESKARGDEVSQRYLVKRGKEGFHGSAHGVGEKAGAAQDAGGRSVA
jgi:hypothetical protein